MLLRENPRLVCAPDAAFLLSSQGQSKVYYLEQDRGTSGAQQISNSKTLGYAAMADGQLHWRHFPDATMPDFSVLMVAPNAKRRDALRRAMKGKAGEKLWRFVAAPDLTAARPLYEPIYFACDGEDSKPLLRRL